MATSIAFTDGAGAVTLTNGKPVPGDRFTEWQPLTTATEHGAGVEAVGLGTGVTFVWSFRTDYGAKFSLRYIPRSKQAEMMRLKRWLEGGNTITVNTGDAGARNYTCRIWPGTKVQVSQINAEDLTFTLTLSVKNTAAADMICAY